MGFKNQPATIGGHTLYIGITGIPNGTSHLEMPHENTLLCHQTWLENPVQMGIPCKWDIHLETMNFQVPYLIPRG